MRVRVRVRVCLSNVCKHTIVMHKAHTHAQGTCTCTHTQRQTATVIESLLIDFIVVIKCVILIHVPGEKLHAHEYSPSTNAYAKRHNPLSPRDTTLFPSQARMERHAGRVRERGDADLFRMIALQHAAVHGDRTVAVEDGAAVLHRATSSKQ